MPDLTWPKIRKLLRAPDIGFNAEVFRYFKNENLDPADVGGRIKVRDFCLIGAKDSRSTALSKIQYFRDQVQRAHLKPTIIGVSKSELDASISPKYKPHVILYFRQDLNAVPNGMTAIEARISFRLMNQTSTSITRIKIEALASRIRAELAVHPGWTFDKGKYIVHYNDPELGYHLQIYALSTTEGERVVKKILSIQNHVFNEKLLSNSTPGRNSENTPSNIKILGKTYKEPRWRPTASVRFLYADLILHDLPEPICLVDRSGIRPNPVEAVY